MNLSKEEKEHIIQELKIELKAKPDGSGKNLIVPSCPFCGHEGGKYGIYIGKETDRKKPFMSHCFSCGKSTFTLEQLLKELNRTDLMIDETFNFNTIKNMDDFSFMNDSEIEIDDELSVVEMPECYTETNKNLYLERRGYTARDYKYFPVGTTRGMNFKFDDYVIFPIVDNGDYVGYVSRHTWDKTDIDDYNKKAKRTGKYQIMRYKNSTENDFVKLLYNYDSVIEDETDTVILVEGVFDVIALTRTLNLYDNHSIAVVATFGKKVSDTQIYKLQSKGVKTIIIGYDGDAVEAIKRTGEMLNEYFEVFVADIADPTKDFDNMNFWEIYDTFAYDLKTITEYRLNKIQL